MLPPAPNRKDTVLGQRDPLPMLVIQLQPREANVVGVTPAGQQLELENDCATVKEERSSIFRRRPQSGRGDGALLVCHGRLSLSLR